MVLVEGTAGLRLHGGAHGVGRGDGIVVSGAGVGHAANASVSVVLSHLLVVSVSGGGGGGRGARCELPGHYRGGAERSVFSMPGVRKFTPHRRAEQLW